MSSGRVYLLLFVVFSLTASLAFAATVSVAPATAAPGASIKVSGSGFAPAETINLMFENAAIARATADESGQFALSFNLPDSVEPGVHTLQANTVAGENTATASLTVVVNWRQFKNSPNRTGFNPSETTINRTNATSLTLSWQGLMGDLVDSSSPAVVNGLLYVGSFDGKLYAFDANGCAPAIECQPLWTGATQNDITSSPAVANGIVYIGSADHRLYAFRAKGCGKPACARLCGWEPPVAESSKARL